MPRGVEIGKMRHFVTWQQATLQSQPGGEPKPVWTNVETIPSLVENLTGKEQFYAQQVVATATHKITLRQVGNITSNNRFLWTDPQGVQQTLNIGYVQCIGNRNEFFEVLATVQK